MSVIQDFLLFSLFQLYFFICPKVLILSTPENCYKFLMQISDSNKIYPLSSTRVSNLCLAHCSRIVEDMVHGNTFEPMGLIIHPNKQSKVTLELSQDSCELCIISASYPRLFIVYSLGVDPALFCT